MPRKAKTEITHRVTIGADSPIAHFSSLGGMREWVKHIDDNIDHDMWELVNGEWRIIYE